MGKGSKRRPPHITQEELDKRWELAFGQYKKKKPKDKKYHMNVEIK